MTSIGRCDHLTHQRRELPIAHQTAPTHPAVIHTCLRRLSILAFSPLCAQLQARGVSHFGSGWAWLIVPPGNNSKLIVTDTLNQDNPLMKVSGEMSNAGE
jgi:hypothetical protein